MMVYALIIEAYSDDDRLIGIYSSVDAARTAYREYEFRGDYQFYRIEAQELDGPAIDFEPGIVVWDYSMDPED